MGVSSCYFHNKHSSLHQQTSLTMGTEVEVQFGNSLQAAMARKLRDSDIATQWTLNYQLNSKLRMQFTIASTHPYPRTLLFQYSGDSS